MDIYERERKAIIARKNEIIRNGRGPETDPNMFFSFEGVMVSREELIEGNRLNSLLEILDNVFAERQDSTSNKATIFTATNYLATRNCTKLERLDPRLEIYFDLPTPERLAERREELSSEIEILGQQGDYETAAYKKQELAILNDVEHVLDQLAPKAELKFDKRIASIERQREEAASRGEYEEVAQLQQQISILRSAQEKNSLSHNERMQFFEEQLAKARDEGNAVAISMWEDVCNIENLKQDNLSKKF